MLTVTLGHLDSWPDIGRGHRTLVTNCSRWRHLVANGNRFKQSTSGCRNLNKY